MKKILTVLMSALLFITTCVVNPVNISADLDVEWISTSDTKGNISESIVDGKRYWQLDSTQSNDNGDNPALFEPKEGWSFNSKDINLIFDFEPVSNADETRFSLNIFHSDPNNAIMVGYDRSGWYWEYKLDGTGDWYSGDRVAAPEENTSNKLRISLKDNKLLAWNTTNDGSEVLLFDKMLDANIVNSLYEKSTKGVVKLGTYGNDFSSIRVLADNQDNIIIPEPEFERPVLDRYEDYEVLYDFETMTDEELGKLFNNVAGNVGKSLVDYKDSKALKLDFNDSSGKQIISFRETPLLQDMEIEADITFDGEMKRFGPAFRIGSSNSFAYIALGDAMNEYFTEHFGEKDDYSSTTQSTPIEPQTTYQWKARIEDNTLTLFINGEQILSNRMDDVQREAGAFGFIKDRGTGTVYIDNVKISKITPERPQDPSNEDVTFNSLVTPAMEVKIDESFPRVHSYTMSDGKVMDGQLTQINKLKINDVEIEPTVSFNKISDTQADYVLDVTDGDAINATLYASLVAQEKTLSFKITKIENHNEDQSTNDRIIRYIEIPNHNLISVKSSDNNANLMGTVASTNTTISGDHLTEVNDQLRSFFAEYMYAFVSNDELSAGITSNSQYSTGADGFIPKDQRVKNNDFVRITAQAKEFKDFNSVGLSSSPWIYHRDVKYNPETTAELPEVSVVITGDRNDDKVVDWQDGAIAFRDIMYSPIGAELVKDLVAYRIAMNFGSHAQNPFLSTLDGIKKVNLHTDGLGQSILLKGYGSEGHDSGHLNYADIGKRIGGVEEMQYLLNESVKYGASIGIHVNASETYPESKYFEEDRLMKDQYGNYSYGWNWIDQGININASYDLANGRRQRFEDLKNLFTEENLGWIYVDVWGNGQSGDNNAWASHQLAKEIHDQGWRLGGEWGYAFEPDSTFQHWAADLTYGGYTLKGFNSSVMRFIFNHQRDAWIADYPKYSGAAEYPLLGGYNMKDFEGWQGRNDYNGYMVNLFENNLSTKFLQHFTVNRWVDGTPVSMRNPDGKKFSWTPEMLIELVNEQGDKVVIERGSNDYENQYDKYRSRTMTLNGRKFLENDTYLIPWNWDESGNALSEENHKFYHFNKEGGTTTWELPSDWKNSSVMYYELTETGNKLVKEVSVENGTVTLEAKENTAYVIYKGEKESVVPTYGNGAHIVDPGFNTQNLEAWDVIGDGADVVKSQASNDMLRIEDNSEETRVSQILTDLVPGEKYVAYVGVDNRSNLKASIELDIDGEITSNYTYQSIAKNYIKAYAHNTNSSTVNNTSYFQNMFVYFTAPSSGSVKLSLTREAGEGSTYFDDVRVTKNDGNPVIDDTTFYQDFEDNAQGIYPFVIGNIEGVEDNRTHLAELNAPYTQRGWNDKKISDVIDGMWSVKTNGLTQRESLVYQTIPQNVRFEANEEYKVSFSYESGSDDTYAIIIGDGEFKGGEELIPLKGTLHEEGPQTYEFTIKGSDTGQSWFGIYSTSKAPNLESTEGGTANFRSYKDIMIDNVKVQKVANITLKDEVSEFTLTGSNQVIDASDIFTATPNDDVKNSVEAINNSYDVEAFDLEVIRDSKPLDLVESEFIITSPVRSKQSFLFLSTTDEVKGVYLYNDQELTPVEFEQKDGIVSYVVDKLGTYVIDYGKESVEKTDKEALESLINTIEALDSSKYTTESWSKLEETLNAAKIVLNNDEASQEMINTSEETLREALDNLVMNESETLDYSELEKVINKYKDLDLSPYTEISVNNFNKAYNDALQIYNTVVAQLQSVLYDEDNSGLENRVINQEDIDMAVLNLETAFSNLEEKVDKPVKPTEPEKPVEVPETENTVTTSDSQDNTTSSKLPSTGMNDNNWLISSMSLIVIGGLLIVFYKRRKLNR